MSGQTFKDLKNLFQSKENDTIIVSDAEPVLHIKKNDKFEQQVPARGVSVALETVARAGKCLYIARGKSEEDKEILDKSGKITVHNNKEDYLLKRVFPSSENFEGYYEFANQTLWPLCHNVFAKPTFNQDWYEGYVQVNKLFAESVNQDIKKNSIVWVNDYQLALVPKMLKHDLENPVAFSWHIPWPSYDVFSILPQKHEILEGLLACDLIAFHTEQDVINFLDIVDREFVARVGKEVGKIFFADRVISVEAIPLGISFEDKDDFNKQGKISFVSDSEKRIKKLYDTFPVILGVDRLDYTKGIEERLKALEVFYTTNPEEKGKSVYIGLIAPSKMSIPQYKEVEEKIQNLAQSINKKLGTKDWQPIHLEFTTFDRDTLFYLYRNARVCLVTPLHDGMNLVSKEYIALASLSDDPGFLVLSKFAGSSEELQEAILVNPFDIDDIALGIKTALEMPKKERIERIKKMVVTLKKSNLYNWAISIMNKTYETKKENQEFFSI